MKVAENYHCLTDDYRCNPHKIQHSRDPTGDKKKSHIMVTELTGMQSSSISPIIVIPLTVASLPDYHRCRKPYSTLKARKLSRKMNPSYHHHLPKET